MRTRGRTSAAEVEVLRMHPPRPLERVERAAPPTELTPEQAAEWNAVINRMPADWFPRETHPILVEYCRHIVQARKIARLIEEAEAAETLNLKNYDRLLKMAERGSRLIAALATKMRIAQQSTYDKSIKKKAARARPWEAD